MPSIDKPNDTRRSPSSRTPRLGSARFTRTRAFLQPHRPHLLLITVIGCLLVVSLLAESASHDSLLGLAIAFALVLVIIGRLTRDLFRVTANPADPPSPDAVPDSDTPGRG
jgi:hypothetical protein